MGMELPGLTIEHCSFLTFPTFIAARTWSSWLTLVLPIAVRDGRERRVRGV